MSLKAPRYLKNKKTLINACVRLPQDSTGRIDLNTAILSRSGRTTDARTRTEHGRQTQLKVSRRAQLLSQDEVCAAMYHKSIGDPAMFMESPTSTEVRYHIRIQTLLDYNKQVVNCMRSFYQATSMDALEESVCAVCARRLNRREYEIQAVPLQSIPNLQRLAPKDIHPNHDIYDGALLDPEGVHTENQSQTMVDVCAECRKSLQSVSCVSPPKHSLAAGLWIGKVPFELSSLTLPETLLIARIYPRSFVCKLWPKDRRGMNPANLQSALRGNVTSFNLNPQAVSDMADGNLMPRQPQILASLITITFISRHTLPVNWLKGTFRVRRERVRSALRWLKEHNPYYSDITIDDSCLESLPEDDVPEEILHVVRQEQDELNIARENDTYIPEDTEDIESGESWQTHEG
jgi:hypothetical protein